MPAIAIGKARVLVGGRRKKGKKCCSQRRLVANVKSRGIIYGPSGRDELGKNTENEVSQSIFADGKRKVKGKEEFLPSCAKHTACTEYEELLEMMIETLVQKRIIIRFNFRATDRLLRNWGACVDTIF